MHLDCIWLFCMLIFFATCIQGEQNAEPAIAMNCGKNTQHKDLISGKWVTDPSGKQNCMNTDDEILEYCKNMYPDLSITGVRKESNRIKIKAWCSIGHAGPTCRGHAHSVYPYKCLTDLPLQEKPGCKSESLNDIEVCKDVNFWLNRARETCQDLEKVIGETYRGVTPCDRDNLYHGFEFLCCQNPVKKTAPANGVCAMPKATGLCRAAFHMWYYDSASQSCKQFIYGGCGGNGNRFVSEKECQKNCSAPVLNNPILSMGVGPVIPEEAPEKAEVAKNKPIESYFNSPLDPDHEQQLYNDALLEEVKEHKDKLAAVMKQWNSAKSDLYHRGASRTAKQKLDADLQSTVDALKSEHSRKREQLTSAHKARVDAAIIGARENSYNDFVQKLNDPNTKEKQLLAAFKHYLQTERRDQHHTNIQLHSKNTHNASTASLLSKLQSIQERVNNAAELARQRLGPSQTSHKLDEMLAAWIAVNPSPPAMTPDPYEGPIMIDHGGLPPENTDFRETVQSYEDKEDHDDNNEDRELSDETPLPLFPSDFDLRNPPVAKEDAMTYFNNNEKDDVDDNDEDNDDWEDELDTYNANMPSPDFVIRRADAYNERWLIWLGVGGLFVFCALFGLGAVYYSRSRKRAQFARVEVDDHLTPEERQLLSMQQNGYENPTYKFFEKQRV